MERMGDILAKVANRRTALQRRAGSAPQQPTQTAQTVQTPEPTADHIQTPKQTLTPATSRPRTTQIAPLGPRASAATKATRSPRATPTSSAPGAPAPSTAPALAQQVARPAAPYAAGATEAALATRAAPATRQTPTVARVADTRIPTPTRPVAPDAQPAASAEPILELPRRRTAPREATALTTAATTAPALAAMAAPLAATSFAVSASSGGQSSARPDFYAPLMSGAIRASVGDGAPRRTAVVRAPDQGDAVQRETRHSAAARGGAGEVDQRATGSRNESAQPVAERQAPTRRPADSDASRNAGQTDARPQPSQSGRRSFHAPAGMLPLGEAARSYVAAIAPRRRAQADAMADAVAEADAEPVADERDAGRAKRKPGAARAAQQLAPDVCPICLGVGYVRADAPVGDPAFGQALPCVCKERQLEERRRSDLWRISSLAPFEKKTFETFEGAVTPGVREAYEAARRYADDPQGWLVLSGGYGVGKTHLAAAIANHQLTRGAHVFFSIVPDLLDHLRATFAPSSDAPFDEMFDRVREAGLLVLDDLGAENSTAWATEKLFQLINYRYNFRMPTVVTTNHRLLAHMDERIRSRLSDLSLTRHVAIEAPDYRERHTGRAARPTPRPTTNARGRP